MTIEAGMQFIGVGQPKQLRLYWISAGQVEPHRIALRNYLKSLKKLSWVGRSKLLLNTHTIGYPRNGGLMETHIAQGFLRTSMTDEESNQIILCAKKLGRYLIPLEVSKILKKEIKKTIAPHEEVNMQEIWIEFCKKNDADQRSSCTEPLFLEKWFNYVAKNYHEPLPEASPWES